MGFSLFSHGRKLCHWRNAKPTFSGGGEIESVCRLNVFKIMINLGVGHPNLTARVKHRVARVMLNTGRVKHRVARVMFNMGRVKHRVARAMFNTGRVKHLAGDEMFNTGRALKFGPYGFPKNNPDPPAAPQNHRKISERRAPDKRRPLFT